MLQLNKEVCTTPYTSKQSNFIDLFNTSTNRDLPGRAEWSP